MQEYLQQINQAIEQFPYPTRIASLYTPVSYTLGLGGKRIRPTLLLMACKAYSGSYSQALNAAIGLEMFHNFTLLHDDIMDKAEVRRGKPVVHKVWGENSAILSGDAMQILAYQWIAQVEPGLLPKVIRHFSQTALEVCEGQQLDMEFEQRSDVTEEQYLEMIRLKTAVLVGEALRLGALIGGATDEEAQQLFRFGEYVGLAFQLRDDYLDSFGDAGLFGKNIGGDISCNKKTYLLIKAFEQANEQQRAQLLYWINLTNERNDEKIADIIRLYKEIGVDQQSMVLAEEYCQKAFSTISSINCDHRFDEIIRLAEQLLERES